MIQELRTLLVSGDYTKREQFYGGDTVSNIVVPISLSVPLDEHERALMDILMGPKNATRHHKETCADIISNLAYSLPEIKRLALELFDKRYSISRNTFWYLPGAFVVNKVNERLDATQGVEDFIYLNLNKYSLGIDIFTSNYNGVGKIISSAFALAIAIKGKI